MNVNAENLVSGVLKAVSVITISFIVSAGMITGIDFSDTVYAAEDKTITGLGTGTIYKYSGGWNYVYYGRYNSSPVKYRVLDTYATEFNEDTTMLLDCDSILVNRRFDGENKSWEDSEIKEWLNGDSFLNNSSVFTDAENSAIVSSIKESVADGDGNGTGWDGFAKLTGEKIFLLSAGEITRQTYGFNNNYTSNDIRQKSGGDWWLRSPYGLTDVSAGLVKSSGEMTKDYKTRENGISPAFNINKLSIISSTLISETDGQAGAE